MIEFVSWHKSSIEELNYFELAEFFKKVNLREKIDNIIKI